MLPQRYEYKRARNAKQYEFFSEGPKGRIRKLISYAYMGTENGHDYYNLGFGDYDLTTKKINDLIISGNKDRDKILATVAATALEFTRQISSCRIVIQGSTATRTRLYQMKIAAYYQEISELFDIQCVKENGHLETFRKGVNYGGFILERKL